MILIKVSGEIGRIGDRFLNSSSPTSFIPNITQIIGLINSIIGYIRLDSYSFSKVREALKELEKKVIVKKIYVVKVPNVLDLGILRITHDKSRIKENLTTSIGYQYLYNFEYVIEIEFTEKELEERFLENLKNNKTVYTPILGSSECLINVEIIDKIENFEYYCSREDDLSPIENQTYILLNGYEKDYLYAIKMKNEL